MKDNDSILPNDGQKDTLRRYEQSISEGRSEYFGTDELEVVVDYYIQRLKFQKAKEAVDFGLAQHPGNVMLLSKSARICIENGETERARELVSGLLEREPGNRALLFLSGELELAVGDVAAAKEAFDKVLSGNAQDIDEVCLDIAYVYISKMLFETALHFLKIGFKANSLNVTLCFELAFCLEQTGATDEAVSVYNHILDQNPFSNEAWFNLGMLLFRLEDYEKAAEAFDFAFLNGEGDFEALLHKGHSYFQANEFDKAIETYKEYGENTKFDAAFNVYMGECYEKQSKFEEAMPFYGKALELNPMSIEAWAGMCVCLLELERFEQALDVSAKAIAENPDFCDFWIYKAEALVNLDRTEDALLCYKKALEINPNQG
ncbi:MAG: tetratricopeptide repeat protein, partial [Paludibacteraceae bacterium]|nr:tetratricopeptide repeat protein [Paludibacteraceae bacterium]